MSNSSSPISGLLRHWTLSSLFQTMLWRWIYDKPLPDKLLDYPDSQVHGAYMGTIWGRQDPGGPHVGPMNFTILVLSIGHFDTSIKHLEDKTLNNAIHLMFSSKFQPFYSLFIMSMTSCQLSHLDNALPVLVDVKVNID